MSNRDHHMMSRRAKRRPSKKSERSQKSFAELYEHIFNKRKDMFTSKIDLPNRDLHASPLTKLERMRLESSFDDQIMRQIDIRTNTRTSKSCSNKFDLIKYL